MKGILRKFNLNSLFGKVKLIPGAVAGMSGKTKSTIIKVATGVGLAGVLVASAAPSLNSFTEAVLPPVENSQDQDEDAAEENEQDAETEDETLDFSFLSDELNITDIDMESVLGQRVESEVAAAAEGMEPVAGVGVDESGKPLTKEEINSVETKIDGDYFIAPDGTPWVSEDEYNKYIAGQNGTGSETVVETDNTTTTGESYYIAPDGSFWESEEAYKAYINGVNNTNSGTPSTGTGNGNNNNNNNTNNNNGSYLAPDGSYWDSEQAYLDYIAQGQNTDNSQYFVAPDGSFWDSEADYNNYIKDLTALQNTGSGNDDTYIDNTTTNGFVAPDGSYWASEADYNNYINSLNNSNNNNQNNDDTNNYEEDNTNENTSSDYFIAPDGSVWASEEDYNTYMKSLSTESQKAM